MATSPMVILGLRYILPFSTHASSCLASSSSLTDERKEHHIQGHYEIVQQHRVFPLGNKEHRVFHVAEREIQRGVEEQPHHSVAPFIHIKFKARENEEERHRSSHIVGKSLYRWQHQFHLHYVSFFVGLESIRAMSLQN